MTSNKAHHVCYCHTCDRAIRSLGIASHRRAHLKRGELVTITYLGGETKTHGGMPDDLVTCLFADGREIQTR